MVVILCRAVNPAPINRIVVRWWVALLLVLYVNANTLRMNIWLLLAPIINVIVLPIMTVGLIGDTGRGGRRSTIVTTFIFIRFVRAPYQPRGTWGGELVMICLKTIVVY